jgi:hypothetical protein
MPRSECASLAHVAVAADDRDFAGDHDVRGALDAVGQRLAAAVEVVELRLGHGVVDVDGGDQQLALFHHLVEAMHAGGGFFETPRHSFRPCASAADLPRKPS